MREILFRGKQVRKEKWVEGWLVNEQYIVPTEGRGEYSSKLSTFERGFLSMQAVMIDPDTVSQYTGLTDKNGVRIFEGDVVRKAIRKGEQHDTIVTWIDAGFERRGIHGFHPIRGNELEVVGNIWDNMELLGEVE